MPKVIWVTLTRQKKRMHIVWKNIKKFLGGIKVYATTSQSKSIFLTAVVLFVFGDIFIIARLSDLLFFGLLFFYIIGILLYKITSRTTFQFCIFYVGIIFVQFVLSGEGSLRAEKAAVWLYLFLLTGVIQKWKELS